MRHLKSLLDGWCPDPESYYLYELWKEHRIMPFSGGFLDQPASWHHLVRMCEFHDELTLLNADLPSADGMPSFGDLS